MGNQPCAPLGLAKTCVGWRPQFTACVTIQLNSTIGADIPAVFGKSVA